MDGEERERKLLADQIARAKMQADAAEETAQSQGLEKKDGEKISLSFNFAGAGSGPSTSTTAASTTSGSMAPPATTGTSEAGPSDAVDPKATTTSISFGSLPSSTTTTSAPISFGSIATNHSAPVTNPLKRPAPMNVFKSAKVAKTDNGPGGLDSLRKDKGSGAVSEVERLMKEDQARKNAKQGGGQQGYGGFGPRRDAVRR
jgi:DNA/RNA-binding protein KIN17